MSIETVPINLNGELGKCLISDFIIDSDDVKMCFANDEVFNFSTPKISINKILLEDNKERLSSITILNSNIDNPNWVNYKKMEIDNCSLLFISEKTLDHSDELNEWLEKCISSKELYSIFDKGALYIQSGFGPGVYSLMVVRDDNNIINGLYMEFIKEKID